MLAVLIVATLAGNANALTRGLDGMDANGNPIFFADP